MKKSGLKIWRESGKFIPLHPLSNKNAVRRFSGAEKKEFFERIT